MCSLKIASRALVRTPFVTAVAIVSLALGIGATAGIFSVFHQVLLQSLAVPDPSALVGVGGADGDRTHDLVNAIHFSGSVPGCSTVFQAPR